MPHGGKKVQIVYIMLRYHVKHYHVYIIMFTKDIDY